jgi:hypothetical protein
MTIKLYEKVVVTNIDAKLPNIKIGDIGYVIEDYGDGNYEVEFVYSDGSTREQVVLSRNSISEFTVDRKV